MSQSPPIPTNVDSRLQAELDALPRQLSLDEAAKGVAQRRSKVPVGLDNHLQSDQQGAFDQLADQLRKGLSLSASEKAQLVAWGRRDGLISLETLEPTARTAVEHVLHAQVQDALG